MKLRTALPLAMAALLLAGCGPKTIISMLLPERYSATSTVTFTHDGATHVQSLSTHCKHVDQSDSIAGILLTSYDAEHHWWKRPDGALLILGDIKPCRFMRGEHISPVMTTDPDSMIYNQESLLFDDATAPARLELLSTLKLMDPHNGYVLGAHAERGARLPVRDTLRAAFPGLPLVMDKDTADAPERGFGGLTVRAYRLRPGVTCAPAGKHDGDWQEIPKDDKCRHLDPCRFGGPSDGAVCGEELGGFPVRAESDFTRLRIDPNVPVDPVLLGVLWREALATDGSISTAEICIENDCFGRDLQADDLSFHSPRRGLVIEVTRTRRSLLKYNFYGSY